ncbi:MAG: hypothetical protein AAF709_24695, partial [Pseudomonadota bacterium]
SAITGSNFGDAVEAGLPDVIGQVIGRSFVGAVTGAGRDPSKITDKAKASTGGTPGGSTRSSARDGKFGQLGNSANGLGNDFSKGFDNPVQSLQDGLTFNHSSGDDGQTTLGWLYDVTFGSANRWLDSVIGNDDGNVTWNEALDIPAYVFNQIIVQGNRLADQATTIIRQEAVDMAIYASTRQSFSNPMAVLGGYAASRLAPFANSASGYVSDLRESYIGGMEGVRAAVPIAAPVLRQTNFIVGGVSGLVQGGLALPQLVAAPEAAAQALGSAAVSGLKTVGNTPSEVLARRAYNAVASTSSTRREVIGGEVMSAFVPVAGVAGRAGRLAQAGRTAVAAERGGARFGISTSTDYRATFFEANPGLKGKVVVHHAVEQQALKRYPGLVSEAEIHSLENLRGIPKSVNSDLHLSKIRREWNQFYRQNANPTQQQLLNKASEIDARYGSQFNPPVR